MVSVIICFYERTQHLFRCLDSLEFNRDYFDEVVISDDGSSHEASIAVQNKMTSYSYPIHYAHRNSKGFEVAAARNNGIRHAKGDYLIFFDCDFLVLAGTVKVHVDNAKSNRFVVGHCKYLDKTSTSTIFTYDSLLATEINCLYHASDDKPLMKMQKRFIRRNILMKLKLASYRKQSLGGHFSIFRNDIEAINGYDENYKGWGGEDEDLGRRLVLSGTHSIPLQTKAKVLHLWHKKEIGDNHWRQGPNIDYFERKKLTFFCSNGLL
jgi:glycosyltransferase involved in cell wall biosynthesis